MGKSEIQVDEMEWIELNKQSAVDRTTGVKHQETPNEKLMRKFKENPLIPLGAALTTGFLVNGLIKFGRRDSAASQVMMRGRIAAHRAGGVQGSRPPAELLSTARNSSPRIR